MDATTRADIDLRDGLAVRRSGGGNGMPFVFIHGFGGDAMTWGFIAPMLPPDSPVVTIELPNHGASPRRPVRDFASLVDMVAPALLAASEGAVHLVGHSLGGGVALALADQFPYRVLRLTLIAPAGLGREMNARLVSGLVEASNAVDLGRHLRQLVFDPAIFTPEVEAMAWELRADPALRAAQSAMANALFPGDEQAIDLRDALHRLAGPTQLIWGREDAVLPWSQARVAPDGMALHVLDDCGHLPHIEHAARVARLLSGN